MNTRTLAAALAGAALFGLTAAPARAQTAAPGAPPPADAQAAPAKAKAKTPVVAPVTLTVTNSRKTNLVWLLAAEPGSANWKTVLGVVKPGKKALTKLSQTSNCHVDLQGKFADGKSMDASGFNVCADKTLNLTD